MIKQLNHLQYDHSQLDVSIFCLQWTCVHDIQGTRDDFLEQEEAADGVDPDPSFASMKQNDIEQPPGVQGSSDTITSQRAPEYGGHNSNTDRRDENSVPQASRFTISINVVPPSPQPDNTSSSTSDSEETPNQTTGPEEDASSSDTAIPDDASANHIRPLLEASRSQTRSYSSRGIPGHVPQSLSLSFSTNSIPLNSGNSVFFLRSINQDGHSIYTNDYTIRQNVPRLKHYIEEPIVGRGFIKELCFSNDGRLICSPFGYGFRLLAFDPYCRELCDSIPDKPTELHELASNISHAREVVTCKFSPTHCLVVSGCLNGKIDFHQPLL